MQEPHHNGDTPVFDDLVDTLFFSPDAESKTTQAVATISPTSEEGWTPATKAPRANLWFAIGAACSVLTLSSGLYVFDNIRNNHQTAAELSAQIQPEPATVSQITMVDPAEKATESVGDAETEVFIEPGEPEVITLESIAAAADAQVHVVDIYGARGEIHSSATLGQAGLFVTGFPTLPPGIGIQMWTTNPEGVVSSAGMVTPTDNGTWMPVAPGTTRILLSEEPETSSENPTGGILIDYGL